MWLLREKEGRQAVRRSHINHDQLTTKSDPAAHHHHHLAISSGRTHCDRPMPPRCTLLPASTRAGPHCKRPRPPSPPHWSNAARCIKMFIKEE